MTRPAFPLEALDKPSVYVGFLIVLLSCLLYIPFLAIPFLPDDYLQVTLARKFGPISQWGHLFEDPLYRNRATSLVLTYWTDRLFPLSSLAFGMSSIVLHAMNALLVYGLGAARSIGWRLSALTAIAFALQERDHEAVVWYAALPELLVFLFGLATLVLWIRWLNSGKRSAGLWMAMLSAFVLAAFSKESAVAIILLMILLAFLETAEVRRALLGILPIVLFGTVYVVWIFRGQEQNHHFSDGTFVIQAGFLKTMALSAARGLWVWGWAAIVLLLVLRKRKYSLLIGSILWMLAALLPYSFLNYMQTVPSRHHYLAAVGCSLIIAMGLLQLYERRPGSYLVAWCLLAIAIHHAGYLWTVKYRQFEARSQPIEAFIQFLGSESHRPVAIQCSEYLFLEARPAAHLRYGEPEENLVLDLSATHRDIPAYCLPGL